MMDVEQALTFKQSLLPPKDFGFLVVPQRLRHSETHPFHFGTWSRIAFGSGCALTVANLYYCQPLLIQMSADFRVTYKDVSLVPTMYQVGYCIGLLFISPLGDLISRRQLILVLVTITTCLSVGLALSKNLLIFQMLAFLLGVFNVTPQVLIPFAADLASPKDRGAAISILQSGIMLGILLARVIAGVIAYYFQWRVVFYVSIGIQVIVLCGTYLLIPDQPPRNLHLGYFKLLYTMAKYLITEPQLIQAVLINVASVACWSSFWVTLTFFLAGPPYHYSTLYIGLFGLLGVLGVFGGPLFGQLSRQFGPWLCLLAATCCLLALQGIETAAAGINIAVIIIYCLGLNALRQSQTVSLQTIVFGISEDARSRLNAVLTLSLSAGQAMGTSAGSQVFLTHGWRAASALSMAFYGWQLIILLLRGPNCKRHTWFGYEGGFAYQVEKKQNGTATPATQTSSMFDVASSNLSRVEHQNPET